MSDTDVDASDLADAATPDASAATADADVTTGTEETADAAATQDDAASARDDDAGDDAKSDGSGDSLLIREGDIAADYLERLLDIADFDGDIDLDVENGRAAVAVVGSDLRSLVGGRGETLDALQELTRLAVQQQTGVRSRLMLDISGFRQQRRDELVTLANETAQRVSTSGEPVRLRPMNPFERKVVHDAVSAIEGIASESEGEEPNRRVVVLTAG